MGLRRTLTVAELRAALERVPVQVRVAYFAAGNVRGTWARPQAQPAAVALADLEGLSRATAADAQTWTRRAARQVIEAKALGRVLGPSVQPDVYVPTRQTLLAEMVPGERRGAYLAVSGQTFTVGKWLAALGVPLGASIGGPGMALITLALGGLSIVLSLVGLRGRGEAGVQPRPQASD